MEFKNPFWNRLFNSISKTGSGKKTQEDSDYRADDLTQEGQAFGEEQAAREEQAVREEPSAVTRAMINQLVLPLEHPFILLYELWTEEHADAPLPHLRLDDIEDPSNEAMERELARLRKEITAAATSRLEEIPRKLEEDDTSDTLEGMPDGQDTASEGEEAAAEGNGEEQEVLPVSMDALPMVYVTSDRMAAWLVVFPPVGPGAVLNRGMLDEALKASGVTYGVDTELLDALSDRPNRYFHLFLAAKGQPVVHGKDGYVEDFFKRAVKQKFAEDEHGRIDYFHLNLVQNINKGEVICQAVPPVEGVPGRTVLDQEIPCKTGKEVRLPKGRNTEISEDGTQLLAVKDGRLEFTDNVFKVKSVLEISGNVDFSTGNINFVGDVHIHGDVSGGFSVKTVGDITIDGVVEAAEIEAGGDLIVAKGILGDSRAVIRAHHNIFAKYIENCTVHSRGNLQTDCMVNCNVYCDGEVHVRTGRGIIVGGRISAAQRVDAKIVGSKSESVTYINLGGQPCANYERTILEENIGAMEAELEKLDRQPDSPARTQRIGKLRLDLSIGRMKLGQFDKELKKLKERLDAQGGCKLKCDIAYPGMVLTIGDAVMHLAKETSSVNARMFEGEILLL
ncbi:MAG: FapA family protein [Lachnospiraceae bacterium]